MRTYSIAKTTYEWTWAALIFRLVLERGGEGRHTEHTVVAGGLRCPILDAVLDIRLGEGLL